MRIPKSLLTSVSTTANCSKKLSQTWRQTPMLFSALGFKGMVASRLATSVTVLLLSEGNHDKKLAKTYNKRNRDVSL